jgi:hypothetical protein
MSNPRVEALALEQTTIQCGKIDDRLIENYGAQSYGAIMFQEFDKRTPGSIDDELNVFFGR